MSVHGKAPRRRGHGEHAKRQIAGGPRVDAAYTRSERRAAIDQALRNLTTGKRTGKRTTKAKVSI